MKDKDMTNRFDAARLQPLLIVIALVATVIAALALLLAGRTADRRAEQREQVAALRRRHEEIRSQKPRSRNNRS